MSEQIDMIPEAPVREPAPIVPSRMVNGRAVLLSAEEIAEQEARDAAYSPPEPVWEVPKLVVVERLAAAGLLRAAHGMLGIDVPAAQLSDEELIRRERWLAAVAIRSDDAEMRGFVQALRGDPDEILARP